MAEPRVFVYVHPAYTQTIFYTQTHLVFDQFRNLGATVMVGDEFLGAAPGPEDKLVVYGNVDSYLAKVQCFVPTNRCSYVVDEGGAGQQAYDRALGYMNRHDIRNIIMTYQNAEHVAKVVATGARTITMPQCVPGIRIPRCMPLVPQFALFALQDGHSSFSAGSCLTMPAPAIPSR